MTKRYSLILIMAFGMSIPAMAQVAGAIDTRMFASNSGHWYGIKDAHNVINPKKGQPKYKPSQLKEIGDNILLYQKNNGGWAKNYDVTAILTPDQVDSVRNDKANYNTTFDNGTTYTHVAGLAQIFNSTHDKKYADAAIKGIDFILAAQYDNGGWPQYYPIDQNNYSRHITYNDDAYVGIMNVLKDIRDDKGSYGFVNAALREKVSKAFDKGIECILNTQINDFGELTAWCQQHDAVTLQPAWARAYEMPSICNAESAGIVQLLMDQNKPSARMIKAVKNAVRWFEEAKIEGIKTQRIQASAETSAYKTTRSDVIVVQDASAPPIWPRFSELQTHRPLFCNRDSKLVYSLAEVARERRSGYAWYTYNPQKILDRYPEWAKKWNVSE